MALRKLVFDPSGMLLVSLGDGGSERDQLGNGKSLATQCEAVIDCIEPQWPCTGNCLTQCYNKAGNKPQGVPKSFGPTALATPPTPFPVRHGQTTASLSLGPLGPGTFGCPSGQILFLDAVSYSNTVVSDATGNSANSTPDPISATLHIRV